MQFRSEQEINDWLTQLGRNFVEGSSDFAHKNIIKIINKDLYGRKPSKYYDRTNRIPNAIIKGKIKTTGTSRKRVGSNVEFDWEKLPTREPVYRKSGVFGGTRTTKKFGAHVSIFNKDNRKWMPKSIEHGWTTFAGRGKKIGIVGVHAFERTRKELESMMRGNGVTGWISGGDGNIKMQKTK